MPTSLHHFPGEDMLSSYPSIYNLGHKAVNEILRYPVIVEEKLDGSQISFGVDEAGELHIRSKGAVIHPDVPQQMFAAGVGVIKSLKDQLQPGWTYRGEYLAKAKHNVLVYSRIPERHIILFDIAEGPECYLDPARKHENAAQLGLEVVPVLYGGVIEDMGLLWELLECESCLGGQRIEGVVIKPADYGLFGRDKKVLMAKFVSEAFKEVHAATWKEEHGEKGSRDILQILACEYATPARWQKALIHLREEGKITDSPKDIGPLIATAQADIIKECAEEIGTRLMAWAWPQLKRSCIRGLPDWYRTQLAENAFQPVSGGSVGQP